MGSVKTMLLILRAQSLATAASADRPSLVMCFNRTLASRIEALRRQRGSDCVDALARVLERAVDSGRVPGGQYTVLLIVEAQDFEVAWLRMAARMVKPNTQSLLQLGSTWRCSAARGRKCAALKPRCGCCT